MLIIVSKLIHIYQKTKYIKEYLGTATIKLNVRRLCQKPTLRYINVFIRHLMEVWIFALKPSIWSVSMNSDLERNNMIARWDHQWREERQKNISWKEWSQEYINNERPETPAELSRDTGQGVKEDEEELRAIPAGCKRQRSLCSQTYTWKT